MKKINNSERLEMEIIMKSEKLLKEEICEIGRRVYTNGFVAANDGNISVKISDDEYLTTPTGISKGYLTPDMIVKVNSLGEVLDGTYKPSSEIKVHLKVYKERPDVGAVVHAHPPYATVYAVAGIPLDKNMLPETVFSLGSVPIAEYAIPGSQELADGMVMYLQRHDALLLQNHGAVTVGQDLVSAFYKLETLEFYARITFLTSLIGGQKELPKNEIEKLINNRIASNIPGRHPAINL